MQGVTGRRLLEAWLLGVGSWVLLSLLAWVKLGNPQALATGLISGGLVLAQALFTQAHAWPHRFPTLGTLSDAILLWFAAALWLSLVLGSFLWLWTDGPTWFLGSPHNLGDASLHVGLAEYLSRWPDFWPEAPWLSGAPLGYPMGMNLLHALLIDLGWDVRGSYILLGLAGSLALGLALYFWAGAWGLLAFLGAGGLVGWSELSSANWGDPQSQLDWKALWHTHWVTQRGLLWAWPAGLWVLVQLREWQLNRGCPNAAGVALVCAVMPLFHAHSWLFLMGLVTFHLAVRRKLWRPLSMVWLSGALGGGASLTLTTGFFYPRDDTFAFQPGWMQGEDGWLYWWNNFGLWLPLALTLALVTSVALFFWWLKARRLPILGWIGELRQTAMFLVPGMLCLILCLLVRFAPWAWDNTKLMAWCYIISIPCLISALYGQRRRIMVLIFGVALLFGGGIRSTWGGHLYGGQGFEWTDPIAIKELQSVLQQEKNVERIAVAPHYAHPALLAGYPVVLGYEAHLWSHGLDYKWQRQRLLDLLGQADWQRAAAELTVSHVVWDQHMETWLAEQGLEVQKAGWSENLVARGSFGELYRIAR